jgi:DNA topoisomerase-2
VRDFTVKQVMDNQELSNVVKILGLEFGKQYTSIETLRYGSVMIMADQDIDGSHIKGLIINFFETFWPSLCRIHGFLKEFVTPIIRCKNNTETIDFFSQTDYELWKINATTDWKIKYYKGLGTSTHNEAKEYFSNLKKHQI